MSSGLLELIQAPESALVEYRKRKRGRVCESTPIPPVPPPKEVTGLWIDHFSSLFHGHVSNVTVLRRWMQQTQEQAEAVLICGPSGSGKTALVNRCARELGLPVSTFDLGDAGQHHSARSALLTQGFAKHLVVLEWTTRSTPSDLLLLAKRSAHRSFPTCPMVVLVADVDLVPPLMRTGLTWLRINLHKLHPKSLVKVGTDIMQHTGLRLPAGELPRLVQNAQGDARRLINSLQFGGSTQEEEADRPLADGPFETLEAAFEYLENRSTEDQVHRKFQQLGSVEPYQPNYQSSVSLCCALNTCTRAQLADELWLLPLYKHTADSLFRTAHYEYSLYHGLTEKDLKIKMKLLTRPIDSLRRAMDSKSTTSVQLGRKTPGEYGEKHAFF